MGISRCMCTSKSLDSLSVVIHERKTVLTRFSPLKDRSAEHVVTGRVHRILTSVVMLGHIQVVCRRVSLGVDGRLFWPWSFNCSLGPRPSLKGRGSGNIPIVDLCNVYGFSSGCKITDT